MRRLLTLLLIAGTVALGCTKAPARAAGSPIRVDYAGQPVGYFDRAKLAAIVHREQFVDAAHPGYRVMRQYLLYTDVNNWERVTFDVVTPLGRYEHAGTGRDDVPLEQALRELGKVEHEADK